MGKGMSSCAAFRRVPVGQARIRCNMGHSPARQSLVRKDRGRFGYLVAGSLTHHLNITALSPPAVTMWTLCLRFLRGARRQI